MAATETMQTMQGSTNQRIPVAPAGNGMDRAADDMDRNLSGL